MRHPKADNGTLRSILLIAQRPCPSSRCDHASTFKIDLFLGNRSFVIKRRLTRREKSPYFRDISNPATSTPGIYNRERATIFTPSEILVEEGLNSGGRTSRQES